MADTLQLFKALADPVRLRVVRALMRVELSVAELVEVLGLPQSTVSRHLKPLRENELVDARRDGTSVYYRRGVAFNDPAFAGLMEQKLAELEMAEADAQAVRTVVDRRRQRSKAFFEEIAGEYGALTEPGGGWPALAAGLAAGFAGKEVADLGAGEGAISIMLAPFVSRVTAVDQSPRMLDLVRDRAGEQGVTDTVTTAEGDLEALPLADASQDACFLSQALHHAARPAEAVKEAARVLRPGGQLVLLDLEEHSHDWMREQWADQWLGFELNELKEWLTEAGFRVDWTQRIAGSAPDMSVILMIGTKDE